MQQWCDPTEEWTCPRCRAIHHGPHEPYNQRVCINCGYPRSGNTAIRAIPCPYVKENDDDI